LCDLLSEGEQKLGPKGKTTKTTQAARVILHLFAKMPPVGDRFEFWRAE